MLKQIENLSGGGGSCWGAATPGVAPGKKEKIPTTTKVRKIDSNLKLKLEININIEQIKLKQ